MCIEKTQKLTWKDIGSLANYSLTISLLNPQERLSQTHMLAHFSLLSLTMTSTQRLARGTAVIAAGGIGLGIDTALVLLPSLPLLDGEVNSLIKAAPPTVLGLNTDLLGGRRFTNSTANSSSPAPKSPSGAVSPLAPLVRALDVLVPLASMGLKLSQ